jgi:hypothetical protein
MPRTSFCHFGREKVRRTNNKILAARIFSHDLFAQVQKILYLCTQIEQNNESSVDILGSHQCSNILSIWH